MPSRTLMAFQMRVRLYMGMLGSWLMSSRMAMALAALAAMLRASSRSMSAACLAVRLMFLGVVLSSAIMLSTTVAWSSFFLYSSFVLLKHGSSYSGIPEIDV